MLSNGLQSVLSQYDRCVLGYRNARERRPGNWPFSGERETPADLDGRALAVVEEFKDLGSMEFSKRLLTEAHVAVAPGVGFGEEGEGYVRIALVENEQRLRQAARGVKKMLS